MRDLSTLGTNLVKLGTNIAGTVLTYKAMTNKCCPYPSVFQGGMYPMFGGGYTTGLFNPSCDTSYAAQIGYMQGAMDAQRDLLALQASKMNNGEIKTKATKADAVSQNQDTTQGTNFEKATKEMVGEDGSIKDKIFKFMSDTWQSKKKEGKAAENVAKEYKTGVSNLAKSYLMKMDSSSGNKDGYISEEEFVNYTIANDMPKLKSDATEEEKAEYNKNLEAMKTAAKIAFGKLDQNGDKTVDWKETAAMFAAVDADKTNGKYNGEIDAKDFAQISEKLAENGPNQADIQLRAGYKNLFGNYQ